MSSKHVQGKPRHALSYRHRNHRLIAVGWIVYFLLLLATPLVMVQVFNKVDDLDIPMRIGLDSSLLALPVLSITMVLTSRSRPILSLFGIERVLRSHRALGIVFLVLVAVHLTFVVISDQRHWAIFDLATQPKQVLAGFASLAAFTLLDISALLRRTRQPRYEGWRQLHLALTLIGVVAAILHVIWLHGYLVDMRMYYLYALLLAVSVVTTFRRWLWRPWRQRSRPYTVVSVVRQDEGTIVVTLDAKGHNAVAFKAGQFIWLKIGNSPFVFEDHPFTIASTAERPNPKEIIVKGLGDFSELLEGIRPGRKVYVDGPYGQFITENIGSSAGLVLIGSGVGMTPLLSILRTLADQHYAQDITLVMTARSYRTVVAMPAIEAVAKRLDLQVALVVGDELPVGFLPQDWMGEVGRIDKARLLTLIPAKAVMFHDYFLCGAPVMVSGLAGLLRQAGVPRVRIHTELFEVV